MKRILIISLFVIAISTGCDQISKLTQFNLEYDQTILIPSASEIDIPSNIPIPDIESNSESSFSVNNTNKDLIENVTLTQMTMTISTPSDGTFSFLKSITVYISADGLDEIEVASKDNIPNTVGNTLELETSDADLQEYIKKDSFNLKVKTVIDELITSDYSIDMHSVFFVDAKILGF